jgi:hypothetical protein
MTAATLRQIAAAEAIEKKPIHIMPSSIAGSIEFLGVVSVETGDKRGVVSLVPDGTRSTGTRVFVLPRIGFGV